MRFVRFCVCFAVVLLLTGAGFAADTGACDAATREAFAADVQAGMSDADLDAKYGHCRDKSAAASSKMMIITNTGSVFYEQMNSCGYHPQNETVFCDVEVRQPFGFMNFPAGSLEYVLFCLDCNLDGFFDFQALGSVHVTDDISGGPLSFYFNAAASTLTAPPMCTVNDGMNTNIRAILSWQAMPNNCNYIPVWGNQIDFTARRDP